MLMAGGDAAGTDPSCFMSHMSAGLPRGSINQEMLHQHNSTASHPQSSANNKKQHGARFKQNTNAQTELKEKRQTMGNS